MTTFWFEATAKVVTAKLAVVEPAGTVTLEGTAATAGSELVRTAETPPEGAALDNATVPVEGAPPRTLVGLRVRVESEAAGVTVKSADLVTPEYVPEIVTSVLPATVEVVTVKFTELVPAGTETLAGTVATAVLELERMTEAPPDGAAPDKVSVPVDELPPAMLLGLSVNEERAAGLTVSVAVFVTLL